jgi:hypothetical protein
MNSHDWARLKTFVSISLMDFKRDGHVNAQGFDICKFQNCHMYTIMENNSDFMILCKEKKIVLLLFLKKQHWVHDGHKLNHLAFRPIPT